MTSPTERSLAAFNALPPDAALAALREVCTSAGWARAVRAGRPYATTDDLLSASDAAAAALGPDDLAQALAGHPQIGRPAPGDPAAAREQRGMADASAALRAEMLELNLAYQEKFGHVFLICATGLTGEQLRDAARRRLGNPPGQEYDVVRTELGRINRIRLTRLLGTLPDPDPASTTEGTGHE